MRLSIIIGMCLIVCAALPVQGQELTNGTFDSNVDGWNPFFDTTIVWDPLDADGSPGSGSALVVNALDEAGGGTGARQCPGGAVVGELYRLSIDILIPENQSATGSAGPVVQWYNDVCVESIGAPIYPRGISTDEAGVWRRISVVGVAPPGTGSVRVSLMIIKDDQGGTLAAHFDNVSLVPLGRKLVFVPAAGYAAGDAGSFWVTDLDVNNRGNTAMTYELWWLPRNVDNLDPVISSSFALAAGESRRHTSVLGEVFGLDPADAPFGALAVASDAKGTIAMARIYNQPQNGGEGTFGQSIPGVAAGEFFGQYERRRILFMSENDDFRANLGCQNAAPTPLGVQYELFDNSGVSLYSGHLSLQPYSNNQLNQVFQNFSPVDGYIDVTSTGIGALVYCYGSVIDNASGDPTTVLQQ